MLTNCFLNDNYEHVDDSIEYILENTLSEDDKTEEYLELKDLFNSMLSESCSCAKKSCSENCHHGRNYVKNAIKLVLENNEQRKPIYECFSLCSCDSKCCGNRLVQFGPRRHLKIIYIERYKSNGLITDKPIVKGEFICEYAGELLTKTEAYKRIAENTKAGKMNYILCLQEFCTINGNCFFSIIVDPSRLGNIGRYLNHSCEPNCQLFSVRVDCPIPKVAIFAAKPISAGEELCINYGSGRKNAINIEEKLTNGVPCLCGTKICKGFLPNYSF